MNQNEIFERIISTMSDKTREDMLKNDNEYCRLEKNRVQLENLYHHMDQYAEAINLVKDYISIVELNNSMITTNAAKSPVKDIFFAFTCMRTNRLPYIHTRYLHTINHNTYRQYYRNYVHSHNLLSDSVVHGTAIDLHNLHIPCY